MVSILETTVGKEAKMKVLALLASPRKGSNTDITTRHFLEGAAAAGHECESVHLYDLEIKPCVDCRACKKGDFACALQDGMTGLYPKIDRADVIVFGTPNYWFGPSAVMKLALDRLRPYASSKKLDGRKAVLIVPAGAGPKASVHLVGMFEMAFDYLNVELVGKIMPTAFERKAVLEDQAVLQAAYGLGASL